MLMLCPSRGRPAAVAELLTAWRATTREASLVVAVDDDDPELAGYQALDWDAGAVLRTGPPQRLGPLLNTLAPFYAAHGEDFIGFLGDDHRPRTQGWDKELAGELAGGPGVAYGNDLFQGGKLPTACVISGDVISVLRYMVPPGCTHLYLDNFWTQLGADLGRLRYRDDVIIEHMHPHAGKGTWDEGYARVNNVAMYQADGMAYTTFLTQRWPGDSARLKAELAP
jgi:hypothetical protein